MRPNTLAEAVEWIQSGAPRDVALAEFVDTFDLAKTDRDRYASIECEPQIDRRWPVGCAGGCDRRISRKTTPAGPRSALGHRSSPLSIQSMVYDGRAVRCHARIPDLQQPRRIRVAQHLHRRTPAAAGPQPPSSQ